MINEFPTRAGVRVQRISSDSYLSSRLITPLTYNNFYTKSSGTRRLTSSCLDKIARCDILREMLFNILGNIRNGKAMAIGGSKVI
jgi:hypothetical protein